jgi:hypothetical protein
LSFRKIGTSSPVAVSPLAFKTRICNIYDHAYKHFINIHEHDLSIL